MAAMTSHRHNASVSANVGANPHVPTAKQQRRMTVPSMPAPQSLDLPEPVYGHPGHPTNSGRPPSPLRNGVSMEDLHRSQSQDNSFSSDPDDDDDIHQSWGTAPARVSSPSPSVSQMAANFAQRLSSAVVGGVGTAAAPASPRMLTDAELEAEAELERARSRREAERIMRQEAADRRLVEDRVLAMVQQGQPPDELRPPPPRSQSMPNPPSPSGSEKAAGWWAAAKHKLTPTKESLTPAQQIIQDTKVRDKERKKAEKAERKSRERSREPEPEWPAKPQSKYDDVAFANLATSASPPRAGHPGAPAATHSGPRRVPPPQATLDPPQAAFTPPRPQFSVPPSLANSPSTSLTNGSPSASRESAPLYAQFNGQGTLDVPGTLLIIAKRFEKLEKWTVGHVRALEERMGDVEKWLVDKEREREEQQASNIASNGHHGGAAAATDGGSGNMEREMGELREDLAEVQDRIGELGREVAKLATAPQNLRTVPSRDSDSLDLQRSPSASSSVAVRSVANPTAVPVTPRRVSSFSQHVSPPVTTSGSGSRTRLPYPTGDYASPQNGRYTPPTSPPPPQEEARQAQSLVAPAPPNGGTSSGLPRATSPQSGATSPSTSGLPPPSSAARPDATSPHVSPTPRKRYTVALGTSIMPRPDERPAPRQPQPAASSNSKVDTAYFMTSPVTTPSELDYTSASDDDAAAHEETIGRASARRTVGQRPTFSPNESPSPSPAPRGRPRPQSTYAGFASPSMTSLNSAVGPVNGSATGAGAIRPLRLRSRSQASSVSGSGVSASGSEAGRFVDPLERRREEKQATASGPGAPKVGAGKPRPPVGQLVAFFDGA